MKRIRLNLFILGILTACELDAQSTVSDSCNTLIITTGSQTRVYPKSDLTLSYTLNSSLQIVRASQSTVVASFSAPTNVDSLYRRFRGYLSYGCINIQCANPAPGYWTQNDVALYPTDTTRLVGIGTALPLTALQVNGNYLNQLNYSSGISIVSNGFDMTGTGIEGYEGIYTHASGLTGLMYGNFTPLSGNRRAFILGLFDLDSHAATVEGHWDSLRNHYYSQIGASRSNDTASVLAIADSNGFAFHSTYGPLNNKVSFRSPSYTGASVQVTPASGRAGLQIQDGTQAQGRVLTCDSNGIGRWQAPSGACCNVFDSIHVSTIVSTGTTPSFALFAGAGTGATLSIVGNDLAGQITLHTGLSPVSLDSVFVVSLVYHNGSYAMVFTQPNSPDNSDGDMWFNNGIDSFTGLNRSLVASTTYVFSYHTIRVNP
jgi:hypothetical protein